MTITVILGITKTHLNFKWPWSRLSSAGQHDVFRLNVLLFLMNVEPQSLRIKGLEEWETKPEEVGTNFFWNVAAHRPNYTASYPRASQSFFLGNMCNGVPFLLGRMVSHGSWARAKHVCASKDKFGVPCRCALKRTWRAPPTTRCSSIQENAVRAASKVSESVHQTKWFNSYPANVENMVSS